LRDYLKAEFTLNVNFKLIFKIFIFYLREKNLREKEDTKKISSKFSRFLNLFLSILVNLIRPTNIPSSKAKHWHLQSIVEHN
jgi:hypothetical protein